MAFIWLDSTGEGISVQETASAIKNRFEDDDGEQFFEALVATDDEEEPYRRIYIDKESVIAIEQGAGAVPEPEEEPA